MTSVNFRPGTSGTPHPSSGPKPEAPHYGGDNEGFNSGDIQLEGLSISDNAQDSGGAKVRGAHDINDGDDAQIFDGGRNAQDLGDITYAHDFGTGNDFGTVKNNDFYDGSESAHNNQVDADGAQSSSLIKTDYLPS